MVWVGRLGVVKTTDHFWHRRFRRPERAHIQLHWIQRVVDQPLREEVQDNGRIRRWAPVPELGGRALRVVLLPDGETVLTAFIDGKFQP